MVTGCYTAPMKAGALCGWMALLLAIAPAAPADAAGPQPGKLLVLNPKAQGIEGPLVLAVTSAIAAAAQAHSTYPTITMLDVGATLELDETRALAACNEAQECQDSLEKLAGVELLLATTLGRVGKSLTLSLALIDKKTAIAKARASSVVDRPEQLAEAAGRLTGELFAGPPGAGRAEYHLPRGKRSIAIFDLLPSGVDKDTAVNLTQILTAETKQIPEARVIARDDIRAVLDLEAQKQLLGCSEDSGCLAEIGGALGVDLLVAGHVGRIAETYVVALRLIDPNTLEVQNRVAESFVGPEDQLVGATRFAVKKLFGLPIGQTAVLRVAAVSSQGNIYVDGVERGTLAAPVLDLMPGRHNLRVVDPDYLEWRGDVYVDPAHGEIALELEERPTRWYESWIFWTAIASAAAVAGGTAIGVSALKSENTTHPFGFEASLPASR